MNLGQFGIKFFCLSHGLRIPDPAHQSIIKKRAKPIWMHQRMINPVRKQVDMQYIMFYKIRISSLRVISQGKKGILNWQLAALLFVSRCKSFNDCWPNSKHSQKIVSKSRAWSQQTPVAL